MWINTYGKRMLFLAWLFLSACDGTASDLFELQTPKPYDDVLQDVEFIITEQNFRITTRMHIGDAIKERGKKDFPRNEVILFCNLSLAEDMLRLNPSYINYCPYKIAVAETGANVTVSTRLLPDQTGKKNLDAVAKKINKTLKVMVEYGASEDPFIFDNNNDASEIP